MFSCTIREKKSFPAKANVFHSCIYFYTVYKSNDNYCILYMVEWQNGDFGRRIINICPAKQPYILYYIPLYKIWHNKSTTTIIIVGIYEHSIFYIPTWVFFFSSRLLQSLENNVIHLYSTKFMDFWVIINARYVVVLIQTDKCKLNFYFFSSSFKDLALQISYFFFFFINIHIIQEKVLTLLPDLVWHIILLRHCNICNHIPIGK